MDFKYILNIGRDHHSWIVPRILTISNQLGNFNHSYNRLQKIEKKLAFSKIFLHIFNQFLMAFGVSMLSLKDHLLKAVSRKS